ncbi:hypothetical protein D029_2548A, partial [Vibrio parahaemolyticus 970107]
MNINKLQT